MKNLVKTTVAAIAITLSGPTHFIYANGRSSADCDITPASTASHSFTWNYCAIPLPGGICLLTLSKTVTNTGGCIAHFQILGPANGQPASYASGSDHCASAVVDAPTGSGLSDATEPCGSGAAILIQPAE